MQLEPALGRRIRQKPMSSPAAVPARGVFRRARCRSREGVMKSINWLGASLLCVVSADAGVLATTRINMEDAVVMPGRPTVFQCSVETKVTLAWGDDREHVPVEFYYDGQMVGRTRT